MEVIYSMSNGINASDLEVHFTCLKPF